MSKKMLTQKQLKKLMRYDKNKGVFTWIVNRGNQHAFIGKVAGCTNSEGYRKIEINSKAYGAHRLAWLYMTGNWPKNEIDHKNGIRDDNRWGNLREATKSINQQNQKKAQKNSSTGFLGVRVNGVGFIASISKNGNRYNLGTYSTPEEAHEVYLKEKRRIHPGNTL